MKQPLGTLKKEQGSALLIMIMILVALSILTFMATNVGKTDARIANAYSEQTKAFIKAEEMLARMRYAIEQMPLPEGIKNSGEADSTGTTITHPIWLTQNLAGSSKGETFLTKDGEPDFTDPRFARENAAAFDGWDANNSLTCENIETWLNNYLKAGTLGCSELDPPSTVFPQGKTRTIIELVSRKRNKGDIADISDTFYYRITIRAVGDNNGEVLAQGITGIRYN